MAEHLWQADRASRLLAQALELNTHQDNAKQVALMLRYKSASDRSFHQALNQLRKLKKEMPQPEIGSVSQNAAQPASAPAKTAPQPQPTDPPKQNGFVSQNTPQPPPPLAEAPRTAHLT
jgi:hypothetical protein